MAELMNSKELEDGPKPGAEEPIVRNMSTISIDRGEVLSLEDIDPALNAKMHLVNDAIDEIGWTPYHWKLFVLNGFGYAVDSLLLLLQSIVQIQVSYEFHPSFQRGLTIALYVGLLAGAMFWGLTADIIGRRFAFNCSLLICSIFAIVAGAAPNFNSLAAFVAISAFGGGGNLILDTTVFLEYLPSSKQWLLTFLAAWWGVGQLIAGLVAWGFMPNYSCPDEDNCRKEDNMGWRYVWYTCGALVFVMSILRITVIRLKETPKYLLGQNHDAQVADTLQWMAQKYGRTCSISTEALEACGQIKTTKKGFSWSHTMVHFRGLFITKKMGYSTLLIWLSWTLIGLAYPLYNVFLPEYLETRGAEVGSDDPDIVWRNYALVNMCGIFGPMVAGPMCEVSFLGRRGTMVIGALLSMTFFFAFTAVRTADQIVGFNCTINFCLNIYYGCLYAYTPEVLPSAHRATGNGISVSCNRVMGIMSALVATYADTSTSVPIYICAALYIAMAGVALLFPYEPFGKRSA